MTWLTDTQKTSFIPAGWNGYYLNDWLIFMCHSDHQPTETVDYDTHRRMVIVNGLTYEIIDRCIHGNGKTSFQLREIM